MKRISLLAAVAVACVFTACKKDEEKPKTKTELLTAKSWRVSADESTEVVNGQTVTTNEYTTYQACEKDDYIKFQADKKLLSNQGTVKCDPADDQESVGAWDFNSDQTKISIIDPNFGSLAVQADIVELTATTLKIKTSSGSGNTLETETVTFTAF